MTLRSFSGTCPSRNAPSSSASTTRPWTPRMIRLGYRQLQRLLHAWRLTVIATSRAGYYEELAAVRNGTAQTRPAEEVIPDWQERLAAARAQVR